MKRFLKLFLLFFIPLLCALGAMEYAVRLVPNEYSYKAEWMEKNADRVETLVLGTSHAFYGINPSYLGPNAFSLANSAQSLQYDKFLLEKYVEKCKNLKRIIIPLSYFTLVSDDMETGSEWWRVINYKIYFDCPYHSDFSKYNFFISNPEPFRAKLFKCMKRNITIECDSLGFGYPIYHKSSPNLSDASVATWVKHHSAQDFSYVERNKTILRDMAKYCQSHHIELVVVTTPVWYTYFERLNPKQLALMQSFAKELKEQNRVSYLNYMTDKRFVANDFTDCNHMSCDGAQKLSTIIAHELSNGDTLTH